MKTILICNQKGGVGKTLIADELAFAFERDNISFNFFDLDEQGSSIHSTFESKDAKVQIVDTAGALQEKLPKWIEASDFVIVPTMMSNRDMMPLQRMIEILSDFDKPTLFVFNRWNRYNMARDFKAWFESSYPELSTCCINDTTLFVKSGIQGKSIVEIAPNNSGSKQILEIYEKICEELNLKK